MIYNKYLPLTFSLLFLVKYFICLQNSIAGIFGTTTTAATEFMVCRQRSLPRQSKSGRGDQCRGQVHSGQDPGYGCGLMAVIAQVLAVMAKIIAKVFKALAERTKVVAWSVRKTLLGRNKSNRGAKGMNYSHSNNPPRVEQQGRRKWRKFMPDRRCRSNGRKFMPGPSAEDSETKAANDYGRTQRKLILFSGCVMFHFLTRGRLCKLGHWCIGFGASFFIGYCFTPQNKMLCIMSAILLLPGVVGTGGEQSNATSAACLQFAQGMGLVGGVVHNSCKKKSSKIPLHNHAKSSPLSRSPALSISDHQKENRKRSPFRDITIKRNNNVVSEIQIHPRKKMQVPKLQATQDTQRLKDIKIALVNFFSGEQESLQNVCKRCHLPDRMYKAVKRYINKDAILDDMSKHRNYLSIQKAALKRIQNLLPVQINTGAKLNVCNEIKCHGMNLPNMSTLLDINPVRALENWKYEPVQKSWHSLNCQTNSPLTRPTLESLGWKFLQGIAQCTSCSQARIDAKKKYSNMLNNTNRLPAVIESLKRQVKDAYHNHVSSNTEKAEAIKKLKIDKQFVDSMRMLAAAKVTEVKYDRTSCRSCLNPSCTEIMVTRGYSDNRSICEKCYRKSYNSEKADKHREQNYYHQMASNSHCNFRFLSAEQKREKLKEMEMKRNERERTIRQEKKCNNVAILFLQNKNVALSKANSDLRHEHSDLRRANRQVEKNCAGLRQANRQVEKNCATLENQNSNLKKENSDLKQKNELLEQEKARLNELLSKRVDLLDEKGLNADDFLACADFMLDTLLSDEKNLRSNLKGLMNGVMKGLLRKDASEEGHSKKHRVGRSEKNVDDLVDMVVEAMFNTSLELSGKSNQCRYSPLVFQLTQAVWSTSPAAYKDLCNLMPFSIPSVRHLQRSAQAAHVKDGRNPKPYQQRQATKLGRGKSREIGYLMCDEMKLKHGIYWSTQTGEAVGLADDMLDMDSIMRRILQEEGDTVEAAVSVNQWQYVSFGPNGLETWFCEHFFNDGFLTGRTLARQYNQVLRSCEAIKSEVYGVVLDAGGNNSRFVRQEMLDELKVMNHEPWISEVHCVATNVVSDNKRKVHVWFCSTHVFKALRGQQFASRPGGKKAFKSESGEPFGWFPIKLLAWLESEQAETEGRVSHRVRLNEKSTYPLNQLKMSVSLVKIVYEHATISYAITKFCSQLGLTPEELEKATEEARMKHPFRRLVDKNKCENENEDDSEVKDVPNTNEGVHGSNIHHCHNLEKVLYLRKVARKKIGKTQETLAEVDLTGDSEEEEDGCDDAAFDERYEELHPCENNDNVDDVAQLDNETDLLSDLESLVFMSHVEALFNDFLLNKREKLTAGNIDTYEKHAKNLLKYFGDWKVAQLKRKAVKQPDWEKSFLAHQTYTNLRVCIGGFFHFSRYMLNEVFPKEDGLFYIPMLSANQSMLEGKFSCQRLTGHDKGSTYSKGITNKTSKKVFGALGAQNAASYDITDCAAVAMDINLKEVGSVRFKKHLQSADEQLKDLRQKSMNNSKHRIENSLSLFGDFEREEDDSGVDKCEQSKVLLDCKYEDSKDMALELSSRQLDANFVDAIVKSAAFEECVKLCHKRKDMKTWLDCLVACNDVGFDATCQKISVSLFKFWEDATFGNGNSFEKAILNFCLSDNFENLYKSEFPEALRNNRLGALYIVDALHCMFEDWVYKALTATHGSRSHNQKKVLSVNSPGMVAQMQRMVGGGIPKAIRRFCPRNEPNVPIFKLLKCLSIKHKDAVKDEEYKGTWYPDALRNENMGNLHLINPLFVDWSSKVMVDSVNFFDKENMRQHRRCEISVGMEMIRNSTLFDTFKQVIINNENLRVLNIQENVLVDIHRYLVTHAFHAYSGYIFDKKYNKKKASSGDMTNVALRLLIQTTGSANGSTSTSSNDTKQKKRKIRKVSTASLLTGKKRNAPAPTQQAKRRNTSSTSTINAVPAMSTNTTAMKGTTRKKRRTSDQDFQNDYDLCIREALAKLIRQNVPVSKLDRRECCAILWKVSNIFKRDVNTFKIADARAMLQSVIDGNKYYATSADWCLDELEVNATDSEPQEDSVVSQNSAIGAQRESSSSRSEVQTERSDTMAVAIGAASSNRRPVAAAPAAKRVAVANTVAAPCSAIDAGTLFAYGFAKSAAAVATSTPQGGSAVQQGGATVRQGGHVARPVPLMLLAEVTQQEEAMPNQGARGACKVQQRRQTVGQDAHVARAPPPPLPAEETRQERGPRIFRGANPPSMARAPPNQGARQQRGPTVSQASHAARSPHRLLLAGTTRQEGAMPNQGTGNAARPPTPPLPAEETQQGGAMPNQVAAKPALPSLPAEETRQGGGGTPNQVNPPKFHPGTAEHLVAPLTAPVPGSQEAAVRPSEASHTSSGMLNSAAATSSKTVKAKQKSGSKSQVANPFSKRPTKCHENGHQLRTPVNASPL